ncbi:MAG: ribosome maturation factor RimP [Gammaproteobacteria bacterium]|nr:MAG: ribosome maturation factor RimP [Gammaproteobacteria bacterium]
MSTVSEKVKALVEPMITAMGYELVGVEYVTQSGRPTLRIYIDCPGGIQVSDCQRVSEQVGALLDVEDPIAGAYNLEVSSPGLDRPLFTAPHFERFAGHRVKIRMRFPIQGRRRFTGILLGIQGDQVRLKEGDREIFLPLEDIEKANVVPEF